MAEAEDRASKALRDFARGKKTLDRLDAARRLREAAEALEHQTVAAARTEGHTWTAIGALYGLSKQAVQQRFRERSRG